MWVANRLNARYVPALEVAEPILDGRSFEQRVGDLVVSGYLFNMATIFEGHTGKRLCCRGGGHGVLTRNVVFSSPSTAGAVATGRSCNGRQAWLSTSACVALTSGSTYRRRRANAPGVMSCPVADVGAAMGSRAKDRDRCCHHSDRSTGTQLSPTLHRIRPER